MDTVAGRVLPARRDAGTARRAGRARPRRRCASSATARRSPTLERSGERVTAVHTEAGERIAVRRRRAHHRVAARPIGCWAARRGGRCRCAPRRRRWWRTSGCRARRRPSRRTTPSFGDGVASRLQRHHRRRALDGATRRCWSPGRPPATRAGAAGPRPAVRAGARAEPEAAAGRLGRHRRRATRGDARRRAGPAAPSSATTRRCCTSSLRPTGHGKAWSAGTPFALAHTFAQTGPFRPANTVRGVDNVVLAGSSTVPGVGVPDRTDVRAAGRRPDHRSRCARAGRSPEGARPHDQAPNWTPPASRDPRLRDAYRRCRELNARARPTFFLATRLLAPAQRPAVHALYGFARLRRRHPRRLRLDPRTPTARAEQLQRLSRPVLRRRSRENDTATTTRC